MSTLPLFDKAPIAPANDVKELRKYQAAGIERARGYVMKGKKRILLVAPCGAGKMVLLASIIKTSSVPVLFAAHRKELIDHCVRELAALGITRIGVIRADDPRADPTAPVQVGSIQTLARRKLPEAGIVIIDEAHRAMGDSYQELIDAYPDAIILGFTATPTRLDGRPLGETFEILDVIATYSELIKAGHIVEPECWSSPVLPDLSGVRTKHDDYDEAQIAEAMLPLTGRVVEHWLERADKYQKPGIGQYETGPRRRTLVFAVNIAHAQALLARFLEAGVRAAHVDGTTPEAERDDIVRRLGSGELELVTNCNIFLEGTDIPSVKCVVHARPTQSLVLYMQSVGRMLRPWQGVKPLLLDHAGNFDRHGAPHEDRTWSLTKGVFRSSAPRLKLCRVCFAYVPPASEFCPHCGSPFPKAEPKRIEETATPLMQRDVSPEALRQVFYNAMVLKAKSEGFKPGFASFRYKEKYGTWPPYDWKTKTDADCASDPFWQKNMETRAKRNAPMKALGERWSEPAELEEPEGFVPVTTEEESFGDWWDKQ